MVSKVEKLRSEFCEFQKGVLEILSELAYYNFDRDILGTERTKSSKILELIYKLKNKF